MSRWWPKPVEQLLCCLVTPNYTCGICKYRLCYECYHTYLAETDIREYILENVTLCPACGELG